jgi:two-component system phosphate regulon sensor histidine kinase PhoR
MGIGLKKKIFIRIAWLAVISTLLTCVLLCLVFYVQFGVMIRSDMEKRTDVFAPLSHREARQLLAQTEASDLRVTIIASDGTVVYDNMGDTYTLDNHGDRDEIREAMANGSGKSSRLSKTLGSQTYYYAIRLVDGYVLRTGKTADSIFAVFGRNIPVIVLIVLVLGVTCYPISAKLTKGILAPINAINLEHPVAVYDELAPFIRTITSQRAQIEADYQALRQRQDTIHGIMENMSEGAMLVDQGQNLLYVNKSAEALFHYSFDGKGHNIREMFRDTDLLSLVSEACANKRGELVKTLQEREYRIYASPVGEIGAVLFFMDVTEQVRGEKMRQEFSANVSHELKTPLTSISGYAQLLDDGLVQAADQPKFIRKIRDEAYRLTRLVEDIMLLSGLDEGNREAVLEDVNLAEIAEDVADSLQGKAQQLGIEIRIDAEAEVLYHANATQMRELLFNLVDNGIQYNQPGGKVLVKLSKENGKVKLSVTDTGIGIPRAEQARVFERFYRVDKSRSKKLGGTGLGLAIVKHICLLYGAQIEVNSSVGEGSTFTVVLKN